jgi:hypothetical protein
MKKTTIHSFGHSLAAVAAVTLVVGCAEVAPVGLDQKSIRSAPLEAPAAAHDGAVAAVANARNESRAAELGACQILSAPAGSKLAFHVYAEGVQIYRWNGTSWSFIGPSAVLSADARANGVVGVHYGGPTWESVSGSKVVATVLQRCTPDPDAIPWLLLGAVSAEGPGVFHRVTFIQRVNTVGGNAPSAPGNFVGEEARVPYAAEYFFYR